MEQWDECLGHVASVLLWLLMALVCGVAVLRYGFDLGFVALQEAQIYLHAGVFMLGLGYALKSDSHVRVDILYRTLTEVQRAWINLLGGLVCLLPVCAMVLYYSWDYVVLSWVRTEHSSEAGGLAFVYVLKTLLIVFPLLLGLSGLRQMLAAGFVLIGSQRTGTD